MSKDAAERPWAEFYKVVRGRAPHETLYWALHLFASRTPTHGPSPFAIDLGCGSGTDTIELLRRGWRVLAIDAHPAALESLLELVPSDLGALLECKQAAFEAMEPLPPADLVNAAASLPFCRPESFDGLWSRTVDAVRPGGRFSGHFFGEHDTWAAQPDMTCISRHLALDLLRPFEVEVFYENERDGTTALGERKHWHVFYVVARKR